jgi:hypothetical protein
LVAGTGDGSDWIINVSQVARGGNGECLLPNGLRHVSFAKLPIS